VHARGWADCQDLPLVRVGTTGRMGVNNKQRKVLAMIFAQRTRNDLPWQDIESLLSALGASISQGAGSRVRVRLHDRHGVFHTPHPQRDTPEDAVRAVRDFLSNAGVRP
jgi:RecB family exonuclease